MNHNQRDSNIIILSSALSLVCGLAGGFFSTYFFNQPVQAKNISVPAIIRAQEFEMVDKSGKAVGGLYSEDGESVIFLNNNKGQVLTAQVGNNYSGFYIQNNKKPVIRLDMDNKKTDSTLQFTFNGKKRVNFQSTANLTIMDMFGVNGAKHWAY